MEGAGLEFGDAKAELMAGGMTCMGIVSACMIG